MAPPVTATSTRFIANSMPTIEINDMPIAVLKAALKVIWRSRIKVSSAIEVKRPLQIASVMIAQTGQGMPVY